MSPKFEQLPEEKQQRMINAALEVFSKNDYQHASTDLIAVKADISKGLLFYYFKNKRSLYLYLVHYMMDEVVKKVVNQDFWAITDFFELLYYSAEQKLHMIAKNPYILDFSVRFFYESHGDVEEQANNFSQHRIERLYQDYFGRIDRNKFRDGVDPRQMLNMLVWMADGYIHQRLSRGQPVCIKKMMAEYQQWLVLFRQIAYKEEYQ